MQALIKPITAIVMFERNFVSLTIVLY